MEVPFKISVINSVIKAFIIPKIPLLQLHNLPDEDANYFIGIHPFCCFCSFQSFFIKLNLNSSKMPVFIFQ